MRAPHTVHAAPSDTFSVLFAADADAPSSTRDINTARAPFRSPSCSLGLARPSASGGRPRLLRARSSFVARTINRAGPAYTLRCAINRRCPPCRGEILRSRVRRNRTSDVASRLASSRDSAEYETRNMNTNAGNGDDARPMSCVEDSAFDPQDRSAADVRNVA